LFMQPWMARLLRCRTAPQRSGSGVEQRMRHLVSAEGPGVAATPDHAAQLPAL